jgi:membrane-bound lytic murein transglycosylase A
MPGSAATSMSSGDLQFTAVPFAELPGWSTDDHAAAMAAFLITCDRLVERGIETDNLATLVHRLRHDVAAAKHLTTDVARLVFETYFVPHRLGHNLGHNLGQVGRTGFVTGYYEPVMLGSRTQSAKFTQPILRRPADLINVVSEAQRGASDVPLTHLRQTPTGAIPYLSRQEIDQGGLSGQGLALFYLSDAIDVFFLQVQGSGVILLEDGTRVRVSYDGKNGYPYTSIGRYLIDQGSMTADEMSLDALSAWLRHHSDLAQTIMWENKSYVFFKDLPAGGSDAPVGVLDRPLTAGRSLAVDTAFHTLGLPVYVHAPQLAGDEPGSVFRRLMVAQDVGSAIKGPERGDIYFGSGPEAGARAGTTKHSAQFWVLLPRVSPS